MKIQISVTASKETEKFERIITVPLDEFDGDLMCMELADNDLADFVDLQPAFQQFSTEWLDQTYISACDFEIEVRNGNLEKFSQTYIVNKIAVTFALEVQP